MKIMVRHKNNLGAALIEVIITVLLLSFATAGSIRGFAISRNINHTASKLEQSEHLANSLMEIMKLKEFKDIEELYKESQNPGFEYEKSILAEIGSQLDLLSMHSDDYITIEKVNDEEYKIKATMLQANKARLNAEIDLTKSGYDKLNSIENIAVSNENYEDTCSIDLMKPLIILNEDNKLQTTTGLNYYEYNMAGNYDSSALDYFLLKNQNYVTLKWQKRCKEIDLLNKQYEKEGLDIQIDYPPLGEGEFTFANRDDVQSRIEREIHINLSKNNSYKYIDYYILYRLVQDNEDGTWEELIAEEGDYTDSESKEASNSEKYIDLNYIYFNYIPLSDKWKSDKVIIKNGTDLSNNVSVNFVFNMQPFDSDGNEIASVGKSIDDTPIYSCDKLYVESPSPTKSITLYTNTDISVSDIRISSYVNTVNRTIYMNRQAQDIIFDINVKITDSFSGATYNELKSTSLKQLSSYAE